MGPNGVLVENRPFDAVGGDCRSYGDHAVADGIVIPTTNPVIDTATNRFTGDTTTHVCDATTHCIPCIDYITGTTTDVTDTAAKERL